MDVLRTLDMRNDPKAQGNKEGGIPDRRTEAGSGVEPLKICSILGGFLKDCVFLLFRMVHFLCSVRDMLLS